MKEILDILRDNNKTISTMESCTGGSLAGIITDIEGASDVFKYGAVTYSNEFKIKMGVDKDLIGKFSVYSIEVAAEMAEAICKYANSDYGIGVTGTLQQIDPRNVTEDDNLVYFSIYDANLDIMHNFNMIVDENNRVKSKTKIIEKIEKELKTILEKKLDVIK